MGLVRILLPLPRAAARLAPEVGRPLLGAALSWCVMPRWVLLRPPPAARRLAWAQELVALYRAPIDPDRASRGIRSNHRLMRSLSLPTMPTGTGSAPRVRKLWIALPAPPGTTWVSR